MEQSKQNERGNWVTVWNIDTYFVDGGRVLGSYDSKCAVWLAAYHAGGSNRKTSIYTPVRTGTANTERVQY